MKKTIIERLGQIIAVLVLGALGSGLWEVAFKPVFSVLYRGTLYVATLGISSVRSAIYHEIAKGFHEHTSMELYLLEMAVILGIMGVSTGFVAGRSIVKKDEKEKVLRSRVLRFLMQRHGPVLGIALGALTVSILLQISIISYTNLAVTRFQQAFTICRPFMSATEEKIIPSKFAQIESKEHYDSIMGEVSIICEKNHTLIPKFTSW